MLASIAVSISGLNTGNEVIAGVGVTCGVASAAIYAFCEAWVDSTAVQFVKEDEETDYVEDEEEGE